MKKSIIALIILLGAYSFFAFYPRRIESRLYGVENGRFHPCPDSPNCVSTQSSDKNSYIEPISTGDTDGDRVIELVAGIVEEIEGATLAVRNGNYLRAEFRSGLLKFVDDVEFYIDAENGILHFKSASRIGYSDMGVNRKRMEELSALIEYSLKSLHDE